MDVNEQMRTDWNRRAREEAHFCVAFGRHRPTGRRIPGKRGRRYQLAGNGILAPSARTT
jgi:hypothetical protein